MKFKTNYIFDFFLPRFCPGCDNKLSIHNNPVCNDCLNSILEADDNRIEIEFRKNFGKTEAIKGFHSKFIFETNKTLQQIIHSLKYNRRFKLGFFLGELLGEAIKIRDWEIDLIVPVPIHHLRKAERGYNQSDYIARGLSSSLETPYSTTIVKRIRYTDSQTGLNMNDRALNVSNAFKVRNSNKVKGKNILLVDDVCTTGATLQACGKILRDTGANTVYACSVAIAE